VNGCGPGQTAEQGTVLFNVTGTSGSLSHSVTVNVQLVPPPPYFVFSQYGGYYGVTVSAGQTRLGVQVSIWGTYKGTVTLTARVEPIVANGPTVSFNASQLTLPSPGRSNLTISTTTATPPGQYSIWYKGTAGNLTSSAEVDLVISPAGDVDNDGKVNLNDLVFIVLADGATPSSPFFNHAADVIRDGMVNILDLVLAASNYQS